jgi:hypothetical protein
MAETTTYIKNTKYQFILVQIIHNSPNKIKKTGFIIYKMTFEINIINNDNIDLLLLHSNSSKYGFFKYIRFFVIMI